MNYSVNYVFPEVMELLNLGDTYIKYPGGKYDLKTLDDLINKKYNIVLHGIIPSSGSIRDSDLCNDIEEFAKYVKLTNQKWLSFHLDNKTWYVKSDLDETISNNIVKIRDYCGNDMPILIENMPPVDAREEWCADPTITSKICKKYNLGLLLDIPHLVISSKFREETVEEYLSKLPLDRVKEIHVSGWSQLPDGSLYDSHIECSSYSYELLDYVLDRTPNCEMVSLEYAPARDYDGYQVAKQYREERKTEDFCIELERQLEIIKGIAEGKTFTNS